MQINYVHGIIFDCITSILKINTKNKSNNNEIIVHWDKYNTFHKWEKIPLPNLNCERHVLYANIIVVGKKSFLVCGCLAFPFGHKKYPQNPITQTLIHDRELKKWHWKRKTLRSCCLIFLTKTNRVELH